MLAAFLLYVLLMKVCVTVSVGQASHPVKMFYVEMFSAAINIRSLKLFVVII